MELTEKTLQEKLKKTQQKILHDKYLAGNPERNLMYNDGEMIQWWEQHQNEDGSEIYVDIYHASIDEVRFMPFDLEHLENIVYDINDHLFHLWQNEE